METQETYTNTVPVNALQTSDSGSYTCSAIARPDVSSNFVAASTNTTSVLNIVVVGKTQLTQSQAEWDLLVPYVSIFPLLQTLNTL